MIFMNREDAVNIFGDIRWNWWGKYESEIILKIIG